MKKRIIAIILMLTICLQCTSCVYVQDALYDMGVDVDFIEKTLHPYLYIE